jgi:predicted aminopeptidase
MVAGAALLLLGGCAATAYLSQSIGGELDLLRRSVPIDSVISDPKTAPDLRARLAKVQAIRNFASTELKLPDNGSYRRYAQLDRPYVIWNVFAAPALSLQLVEWCFPIAGCVGYRGYFSEAEAKQFAAGLHSQGLDVYTAGIPAYSTLGFFDDPVLSTFVRYPEPEIARLLFHELGHQVAYASGDTMFNESFAVSVEREGMRRYLDGADPAMARDYAVSSGRREDFLALVDTARQRLREAYAAAGDDGTRASAKARVIDELRRDYQELRNGKWGGYAGYDGWFATDLNNAKLASLAVYSARVPAFEALLAREHGDLAKFYAEVKRLAAMPKPARDAALDKLQPGVAGAGTAARN